MYLETDAELNSYSKATLQAAIEGKRIDIAIDEDNDEAYEAPSLAATASLRLAAHLRHTPSLVVRYDYGGTSLFRQETNAPICKCGALRCFELEFLPTLVFFLGSTNMDDISSLTVWTCPSSCPDSQVESIFAVPPFDTTRTEPVENDDDTEDIIQPQLPQKEEDHLKPWQNRWINGRITFHMTDVNYILIKRESLLELKANSRMLIPLCGKTVDLAYLAGKCNVVGVDAVEIALKQFISEHKAQVIEFKNGNYTISLNGHILQYVVGDWFSFDRGQFDAAFDRGALVAINPEDRPAYVQVLIRSLSPGAKLLLVATEHSPFKDGRLGPPFNLTKDQVHILFENFFSIQAIETEDRFHIDSNWKERGCSYFFESTYLLTRRCDS
mmetsp:Transcript_19749/g.30010  ORF Transcript_19749/g.30010 Transcript_19749/m.30010 type:complete len:384 (+) Transcript_19749:607-1758(+)